MSHATTRRRALQQLAAGAAAVTGLAGCASADGDGAAGSTARGPEPLLSPWRTLPGGFIAPPLLQPGMPARPGTGMFVKWLAPTAVALRGTDLLVLDAGTGRLWRADTLLNTVSGIAGAPTHPGVVLALGPDGAAWVLDPQARQLLRFGRDARLLQTFRIGIALPSPVALALLDAGATAVLGDGMGAQWLEQRGASTLAQPVAPADASGRRISGVDGLAVVPASGASPEQLWVLDRLAGAVHRVQRDGRVLQTLGRGDLLQPVALAADRFDRVFVVDRDGLALVCLQAGAPARHLGVAALGVRQIGGLAIDDRQLALADRVQGQVVLHRLGRPDLP